MCIKKTFVVTVLIAVLGSVLASRVTAQTFTVLHSFTAVGGDGGLPGFNVRTNVDGSSPQSGLSITANRLYGTARYGGIYGRGTVFSVNTDGMGFTNLYYFTGGSDGTWPHFGLFSVSNTLFGATQASPFKVNTDGSGFSTFNSVCCGNSAVHAMTLSDGILYLAIGGIWVGRMNIDGAGFTNIPCDGYPGGGLLISGTTLYGLANSNFGFTDMVFACNTNGSAFTSLHNFTGPDGATPQGGLILSGTTLYGTTLTGGNSNGGTVFAVNFDGTGFRSLYNFTGGTDGAFPQGGLALSGQTLYGTTTQSGNGGNGTVFAVKIDGSGFRTLHSFTATTGFTNSDGTNPQGLVFSNNTLYGSTLSGGIYGNGTLFSLSIPIELNLAVSGSNLVLSWPTNFTGFTLQSTTDLSSQVWTTNLPPPVVINGQNTVTNPISGTEQFFRLSQ
jgi:uncharacterized repeat protein (TIGR03803 family)